ncbi:MAG: hypothetical protein AAF985_22475 [Bacteroidota bacterium]
MTVLRREFARLLFQCLNRFDFILIEGEIGFDQFLKDGAVLRLLLRRTDLPSILKSVGACDQLERQGLNKGYRSSQLTLVYDQKVVFHLELLHKLTHHSLVILDEEQLLRDKIEKEGGAYFPSIEHLFEWMVLKNYLVHNGLSDVQYNYFRDFHILFKEDLMDAFNQKYGSQFQHLTQLLHFRVHEKERMLARIRQLPANQLMNTIQMRWNEWMGAIRQAKLF